MIETANHLTDTIKQALPLLSGITEQQASAKPAPGKWSPKEIIGHLIDSACNNQQKFTRCMLENGVHFPGYDQDLWVNIQAYQEASWEGLVQLWAHYNFYVAHLIRQISDDALHNTIMIGGKGPFTLQFIAKDYGEHLKHHLRSLFPEAGFLVNSFRMVY